MKRSIIVAVCVLMMLAPAAWAESKIAVVNGQQCLAESLAGKAALAKLESIKDKREAEINEQEALVKKLDQDMQTQRMTMSQEALTEMQRQFQKEYRSYQMNIKDAQEELQRKQIELTKPLTDKMVEITADYGKKHGYDLILEANVPGVVFYASDAVDVTNEITKLLDAQYKK